MNLPYRKCLRIIEGYHSTLWHSRVVPFKLCLIIPPPQMHVTVEICRLQHNPCKRFGLLSLCVFRPLDMQGAPREGALAAV